MVVFANLSATFFTPNLVAPFINKQLSTADTVLQVQTRHLSSLSVFPGLAIYRQFREIGRQLGDRISLASPAIFEHFGSQNVKIRDF